MKRAMLLCLCTLGAPIAFPASAGEPAAPPSFTRKPAIVKNGDQFRIEFAVGRETDVAVSVEADNGRVVRHLAAGRLGTNAPAPLVSGAREQSLTWDGRADYGKDPGPGPFRARVSLGLKPVLQEFIGQDPTGLGVIRAFAVGPAGELFVFHLSGQTHPDDNGASIVVFSREGKYLRTIMPYPSTLPEEKLKGLRRVERQDGKKVPFIYQIETRSYVPGLGNLPKQRAVVTRDGRLAFVGVLEGPRPFANPGEARLLVMNTDGSVPGNPLKTVIAWASDSGANLALSPDEKTIYAAGLRTATHQSAPGNKTICEKCDGAGHGNTWECTQPSHAVYKFGWDDKKAQVLIGDAENSGDGPDRLKVPVSVATDADGNVYVADRGNDRIAVFGLDAKPLAQFKVVQPLRIEVHRKTGAIYVLAGREGGPVALLKFAGYKSGKEVCRTTVQEKGSFQPTRQPLLALDDSADPPILYTSPLARIEDRGDTFSDPVSLLPPSSKEDPHGIGSVMELGLDRTRDLLYVNSYWRYRVGDGKWDCIASPKGARDWQGMWPMHSTYSSTGSVGLDGIYYSFIGLKGGRIYRFDADMNLVPFPAAAISKSTEGDPGRPIKGTGFGHGNGHTADAAGNVYVIWNKGTKEPGDYHQCQALSVYGRDGALKKSKLINTCFPNIFSPRVDAAGNIYVALGLRPGAEVLPAGLKGQVPSGAEDPDAVNKMNGYPLIYGSIAKFPPAGGEIREKIGGVPCNFGHGRPIEVKGAEWIFPGASTVSSWATPKTATGTVTMCMCEAACFDVDEFGRSFFADAAQCRVGMIDTAGNEIGWFGEYGNQDAGGEGEAGHGATEGPLTRDPSSIPLAWPQAVAVGNGYAYVGDRVNRRVVRVKLGYAATETVPLP